MHSHDAVPVVLTVFNRPDCVERLVDALRRARPRRIFVLADAPRHDHPDDADACRRARAALAAIDWPAELSWKVATANLGCSGSTLQGLDWVFAQVPEAIVFDDDTVPAADFFPWCAAMLARYRDAPDIGHVGGRNHLGAWPSGDADHILVRRGSLWGWATWKRAWMAFRATDLRTAARPSAGLHPDPLVAQHLALTHDMVRSGQSLSWDLTWSLAAALAGRFAALPPANLIANIGFGSGALHTTFAGDFRGALPTGTAKAGSSGARPLPDSRFDRWALLIELLAAQRDSKMLLRLAEARHLVGDARLRLHLAPFDHLEDSVAALCSVAAFGTRSPHLDDIRARMEIVAQRRLRTTP